MARGAALHCRNRAPAVATQRHLLQFSAARRRTFQQPSTPYLATTHTAVPVSGLSMSVITRISILCRTQSSNVRLDRAWTSLTRLTICRSSISVNWSVNQRSPFCSHTHVQNSIENGFQPYLFEPSRKLKIQTDSADCSNSVTPSLFEFGSSFPNVSIRFTNSVNRIYQGTTNEGTDGRQPNKMSKGKFR